MGGVGSGRPPRLKAVGEITAEDRALFLELIREGWKPDEAARRAGSTASRFRKFRSPGSRWFSEDFAVQFDAAVSSEEHVEAYRDRIRAAVRKRAFGGSDRLLEKLALVNLPEWETLRHQNFRLDVNVLARVIPGLTDGELQLLVDAAKRAEVEPKPELKLLEPGDAA